jgi:hypothetical protein
MINGFTRNSRIKNYYRNAFCEVVERNTDAWDYQFAALFMRKRYLSVMPKVKLVKNVGIEIETTTHTGGYDYFRRKYAQFGQLEFPLAHPPSVSADIGADERTERIWMGIFPRGLIWLGARFPSLGNALDKIGDFFWKYCRRLFEL